MVGSNIPEASEEPIGLTIDELGRETGVTVRNIRSHQARGLLPPPEVRRRTGYYGPEHVARLKLIRELQDEGFNLRGIRRLLDETHSPGQLLHLKEALTTPMAEEAPQVFTLGELAERFGPVEPAVLERVKRLGILRPLGGDRYEAPAPSLLDVAEDVVSRGVTLDHAVRVIAKVHERCESIAREFTRLFLDDLWKPFVDADYPEAAWSEVVESIERLRPISSQAVMATYQLVMARETEAAFGRELAKVAKKR